MKKNRLRRALVSSIMSLLLCCAMLFSTTYAWLTETVSSKETRIVAGTLDVDLLMANNTSKSSAYSSIAGNTGNLFQSIQWEPGHKESISLAVKNNGDLPLKYTVGLVVKDSGLAELLKYSLQFDDSEQNQEPEKWYSLATDSNAKVTDNISYMTISSERTLAAETDDPETDQENHIDPFTLTIRMKEAESQDSIKNYKNVQCEIDVRIIATQNVSVTDEGTGTYGPNLDIWTPDLSDHIYHFTNVKVSGSNALYETTESVTATSESGNIQIELPEHMLVDIQSEQEEKNIVISVSPTDPPADIKLENGQTAQTVNIQIYGISEYNDEPYILTWNIPDESTPAKIIYSSESGSNVMLIEAEQEPPVATEEGFTYFYNPDSNILKIQSIHQGMFTLVLESNNESEN